MRNQLTHGEFYKLTEWVKANKELVEKQRTTVRVAELATKGLGFVVGVYPIRTACEVAGVERPLGTHHGNKESEQRANILANAISEIADELDMHGPELRRMRIVYGIAGARGNPNGEI